MKKDICSDGNVLYVTTEARFLRTKDGFWTENESTAYVFWKNYLTVFDNVQVLARTRSAASVPDGWLRVDGERIQVFPLVYYVGIFQYVLRFFKLNRQLQQLVFPDSFYLLRAPGAIGETLGHKLEKRKIPYAAEIVGDSEDVGRSMTGWRKHLFLLFAPRRLRHLAGNAFCISYVTKKTLQKKYPPSSRVCFQTHYSSIVLPEAFYAEDSRKYDAPLKNLRLIFIGSLEQRYKGLHVLLKAMPEIEKKIPCTLDVIGSGCLYMEYMRMAESMGLASQVLFHGYIADKIRIGELLSQADLFVMPSLTEGLPRAMIEAMAKALPSIGSRVGGIPELLDEEFLFSPGNSGELAEKILWIIFSPERLMQASALNLKRSKEYSKQNLDARRRQLYHALQKNGQRNSDD